MYPSLPSFFIPPSILRFIRMLSNASKSIHRFEKKQKTKETQPALCIVVWSMAAVDSWRSRPVHSKRWNAYSVHPRPRWLLPELLWKCPKQLRMDRPAVAKQLVWLWGGLAQTCAFYSINRKNCFSFHAFVVFFLCLCCFLLGWCCIPSFHFIFLEYKYVWTHPTSI